MTKKISPQFWLTSFITGCLLSTFAFGVNAPANAQFRGQESQKFFDRGNQVIEQQIQELQREQKEEEEEKNQPKLVTESDQNDPAIENNIDNEQDDLDANPETLNEIQNNEVNETDEVNQINIEEQIQ